MIYGNDEAHILHELRLQTLLLQRIVALLSKPVKAVITFKGEKPGMPGQMTDVQTISASVAEQDAAGQPVTIDPTKISWTVGDPTVASVATNPDGTAAFKALKVGQTSVAVTDSSNGLSAQDTLTVTAGAATSLVIKFGTPA